MRFFTCTPRNFTGASPFYARDSGLLCRGFEAIGVESRAVLLGPSREGELEDLIRATKEELESSQWWKKHGIDGVVLYSWAQPEHRLIAEAIKRAGIRVAQIADTHAVFSPLTHWRGHLRAAWVHNWQDSWIRKFLRTAAKMPYSHTVGILRHDLPMVRTIDAGDFLLSATPVAAERFRRLARRLGGASVADKVKMVPFPVNFHFRFEGHDSKSDEVVAVGRWDSPGKRQTLLMATIQAALVSRESTVFRIFGNATGELEDWHRGLPTAHRSRIILEGAVSSQDLAMAFRRARVMLATTAYEGCHNASAEAVCSGCTIVSGSSPFLCALDWHVSRESGRTVVEDSAENLALTLNTELEEWDAGRRDPLAISEAWICEFHPDRVAARILKLFGELPSNLENK